MSAVVLVCAPFGTSWVGIDWIAIQRRVKRRGCSPLPFRRVLIPKKNRKTETSRNSRDEIPSHAGAPFAGSGAHSGNHRRLELLWIQAGTLNCGCRRAAL